MKKYLKKVRKMCILQTTCNNDNVSSKKTARCHCAAVLHKKSAKKKLSTQMQLNIANQQFQSTKWPTSINLFDLKKL